MTGTVELRGSRRRALVVAIGLAMLGVWGATAARAGAVPIHLKIVGGLAGVSQYTEYEAPFWRQRIRELSGGRLRATIAPFDRSGLRAEDMLQLMRLGVVPFGTAALSVAGGEEPELNAVDLPGLSPDMAALRKTVRLYRPHVEALLRDRYDIELLGIYAYPAQVIFCTTRLESLADLKGRRVRTSSVSQSEMMEGLGALPVVTAFADIVPAVERGSVDCAITGIRAGVEIGLTRLAKHVHAMAISWGLTFFGANRAAWDALPPDLRVVIRAGVLELEAKIWGSAETDTERGFACAGDAAACADRRLAALTVTPMTPQDEASRRKLVVETVLPRWIERCGRDCGGAWNRHLAPRLGITAGLD